MSTYLCENAEKNCKFWRERTPFEIGESARIRCPNCNSDQVVRVAPPDPPWKKFLKRVSIIAVPVVCGGLVWLYVATRPPPPFVISITYTTPPAAKVHPGDSLAWSIRIDGGKPGVRPQAAAESLSPALLPNTGLVLEPVDLTGRKYKLTAHSAPVETGLVKIKVSVDGGAKAKIATNLVYEIIAFGPPVIALPSSVPRILEGNRDSLTLPFTVSDEKTDAKELTLSATVDPSDIVRCNVETNGTYLTLTLSRNQKESGRVKLTVRLVTPDGRETNQTYSVTVAPPAPPRLVINVASTTPPDATIHPGDEVAWSFTVEGGGSSEKPLVSAESLSLTSLPQTALQLVASDETNRKYKLIARPHEAGHVEVRISANLDGGIQDAKLAITVLPAQVPISELLKQARKAWLMKQYPDAMGKCDEALTIDPQCVEAMTIKGGVLYSSVRYTEALSCCKKALEIDPHHADAWFTEGAAEESLKKHQEAVSSYQKFLQFSRAGIQGNGMSKTESSPCQNL